MSIRLPAASRNAAVDAIVDLVDAGGAGTIEIRSGTAPATADDTATGTLLAELDLPSPAFGSGSDGVADLDNSPAIEATAAATGTASWFRMKSGGGATVMDGSVTGTGGGGDIELATTGIASGVAVTVTGGSVTMPAG